MQIKTKTEVFTLVRVNKDLNQLYLTLEKGKHATDEISTIFRNKEETEKMIITENGKEIDYEGFTDFLYANAQEDGNETDAMMICMGKPDLTIDQLKAALLHLSIATDNAEIVKDIEV